MAYSNWKGLKGANYVVRQNDNVVSIVKVTTWSDEGVKFIDSFPIPKRYEYANVSRYWLAKKGIYPMTKKGEADLQTALTSLPIEHNVFAQQELSAAGAN